MRPEVAHRRIEAFGKRFGEAYLYLAYHAAFPLALTPDLLYRLWANFQRDIHGEVLNIPWIAVADLLLSSLCDEVGHELYEMEKEVRNALLSELKANPRFGTERINELSDFLLAYVRQQLDSPDIDTRDFAQAQRWTALAYTRPTEAAREIATALSRLKLEDTAEWVRMASLVETFAEPLTEFEPLLIYTRGMADFTRGNQEGTAAQFSKVRGQQHEVKVAGVRLNLPETIENKHQFLQNEKAISEAQSLNSLSFRESYQGTRILYVDNDADNLFIVQTILEEEGYRVEVENSSSLALPKIESSPPDLIMMEIVMSEIDGYELTERIRQNNLLPFIPILLITEHDQPSVVQGLDRGANDFIRKPVEVDELLARVRSLLRLKRAFDEREQIARQFNSTLQEQQIQGTLPNYQDHEEEFLKAIATRFGFSGKTWLIFLERFREKNTDSLDKDIAAYLEAELLEGTMDRAIPAIILRDRLKAICDKFEAEGCDFQGVTKGRWKIAKRWLREVLYPEWQPTSSSIASFNPSPASSLNSSANIPQEAQATS
jgi:CheY-like chemotaxis protein